ncbi:MAG: C25 family cysteine peptidase [Anaerohalosphaeraceae bacterium]
MRHYLRVGFVFLASASSLLSAGTVRVFTGSRAGGQVETRPLRFHQTEQNQVRVWAEEAAFTSQPGEPDIPWQVLRVVLPPFVDLEQIAVWADGKYTLLEGNRKIAPRGPWGTWDAEGNPVFVWPEGRIIVDGYDTEIYTRNAFWPQETYRLVHKGQLEDWKLVEIAVPLVRYNPVTGEVQELTEANVWTDWDRKAERRKRLEAAGRTINTRRGRERVRELAVNFASAAAEYDAEAGTSSAVGTLSTESGEGLIGTAGVNSKGYVILTTSSIVNSSTKLAAFVAHKASRGWNVSVVTESTWGGGTGSAAAVNIRNWLRANYQTMDILYVLLIGDPHPDTGTVPMRWYDDGRGSAPIDAMYSDLSTASGWDKYWEVVVGRIPNYGTMSELDAILQKTMNYENSQQVLWRRKGLLPMVPLDDTTPAYQCGEQIRSAFYIPNGIASTRIYRDNYGLNPAPEYLLSNRYPATEWGSQPYGFVTWLTHGNWNVASEVIDNNNIWRLNDSYPSAVYQGSCLNAYPENNSNLAYKILQRGAITTVAATRESFYDVGQTNFAGGGSIGTLAYRYTRNMVVNRQTCGLALANAKQQDYIYPPNATRMTLYGDPSVFVLVDPDFAPPTPNPMTWATPPYESGPGSVTMEATTAVDAGGSNVQYYFQCVAGGGKDSGWQSSPIYTDTGVVQTVSTYRVKARDLSDNLNETAYSEPMTAVLSPYPYGGQARTLPGRIQAEHFDVGGQGITYLDTTTGNSGGVLRTREDVDIVSITDGTADYAVDAIEAGEWLTYRVNTSAETADLYLRAASAQDGGVVRVWLDELLLAVVAVPNTGSLNTWQSIKAGGIPLPGRTNALLKLEFLGGGFRLNWVALTKQLPYLGSPFSLPGRIEFEDFDIGGQGISFYDNTSGNSYGVYRTDVDVDIMTIWDGGTMGYSVFMESGEWLEYTCSIPSGLYDLRVRYTTNYRVDSMRLEDGGTGAVLADFALAPTGGWSTWQDALIEGIYLPGGPEKVLRFVLASPRVSINYVEFIRRYNPADLNRSGLVDLEDFSILSGQWLGEPGDPSADTAPSGGDGWVDLEDLAELADNWLKEY